MVSTQVKITTPNGLHLRPAGELAERSLKYHCKVMLSYGDKEISAKSLLGVLSLCIRENMVLTLICDGMDEEKALTEMAESIAQIT